MKRCRNSLNVVLCVVLYGCEHKYHKADAAEWPNISGTYIIYTAEQTQTQRQQCCHSILYNNIIVPFRFYMCDSRLARSELLLFS